MHPEGPAQGGQPDQAGHEVGELLDQGAQLVDHDDEPGQGFGVVGPYPVVALEVGGTDGGQQPLPPPQLGAQRGQGARHQVVVEVGDQADDVGERRAGGRRRRRP